MEGTGIEIIHWTQEAVKKIANKIKKGTKFFLGHGETNSHAGRKVVGNVLASFTKRIKGVLSNVVIGHFPKEENVSNMDVCSMEAEILTDDNNRVTFVERLTGIALANSKEEIPAFAGAQRKIAIYCFENKLDEKNKKGTEMQKETITLSDVKDYLTQHPVYPHQLFDEGTLRDDRVIGKLYNEIDKNKKEYATLSAELEASKKLVANFAEKETQNIIEEKVTKFVEDANLTERQKKYTLRQLDLSKVVDATDASITAYIDKSKKEYAEIAKIFGFDENTQPTEDSENGVSGGNDSEVSIEKAALKQLGIEGV